MFALSCARPGSARGTGGGAVTYPDPNQPYPGASYPNQPYQPPVPGQPGPQDPWSGQPEQPPGQPAPYQPWPAPSPGPSAPPPYPGPPPPPPAYPGTPSTAPTQAFPTQVYPSQVTPSYSPYGYQQYPPPTPPKSRMLPTLLIGGAVVVLLVVVGVGILVIRNAPKNNNNALGPTTSSSAQAPTQEPSPSPTVVAFSGDLRTLLVPLPAGSTKDSNEGNGSADGTVTLEQAAQTYADATFGKTHMQELGFKQGATESWHQSGKYSVQIVLFQFAEPEKSTQFVEKLEDGADTDNFWDARGDLDQIPNGRYYVSAKTNNNGNYNFEIWFSKGAIAVRMNAFGPNKTDVEKLKTLAQQQFAKLP